MLARCGINVIGNFAIRDSKSSYTHIILHWKPHRMFESLM